MKKLLKPIHVKLCGGGRPVGDVIAKRFLPGSVVFKLRKAWYIGDMTNGKVYALCEPARKEDAPTDLADGSELFALSKVEGAEDFVSFSEGRGFFKRGGVWYMLTDGWEPTALDEVCSKAKIWPLRHGLARFRNEEGYGFINRKGKVVVDAVYKSAKDFQHGLAAVTKHTRKETTSYLNARGKRVKRAEAIAQLPEVREAMNAQKLSGKPGLRVNMTMDGRYVLVDEKGRQEPFDDYFTIHRLSCSLALAQTYGADGLGGRYAYIDCEGRVQIPARFDAAHSFAHNTALVREGGVYKLIGTGGASLLTFEGVRSAKDDGELVVLETEDGLIIADHRFYDDGVSVGDDRFYDEGVACYPADDPLVLPSPEAFLRTDQRYELFERLEPEAGECFRVIGKDCYAARCAIEEYEKHLMTCYGMRVEHVKTLEGEAAIVWQQGMCFGARQAQPKERRVLLIFRKTEMKDGKRRVILTGVRARREDNIAVPLSLVDDGFRTHRRRHDVPYMIIWKERKMDSRPPEPPCSDAPEARMPQETARRFYLPDSIVWDVENHQHLVEYYRLEVSVRQEGDMNVHVYKDTRHPQCNTLEYDGKACSAVIWFKKLAQTEDIPQGRMRAQLDEYYSQEYRIEGEW